MLSLTRAGAVHCRRGFSTGASGGRKAKIALAGAGWWSQGWHLPHLHNHPDCEIAAIVDPSFETAHWNGQGKDNHWSGSNFLNIEELGEKYGCPTFADVDDMVAAGTPVDGVLVASNHATHAEIGIKCAAAGYHIMMEKPMTTDVAEARALLESAQSTGKVFMVNNTANWRKNSQLAAVRIPSLIDVRAALRRHRVAAQVHCVRYLYPFRMSRSLWRRGRLVTCVTSTATWARRLPACSMTQMPAVGSSRPAPRE